MPKETKMAWQVWYLISMILSVSVVLTIEPTNLPDLPVLLVYAAWVIFHQLRGPHINNTRPMVR